VSVRARLIVAVAEHPGRSATELARVIGEHPSTASSILKRLTDQHVVRREKGEGPRGGFGYWLEVQS